MNKLPSSFRDPDGFLFMEEGRLFRQINPGAFDDYTLLNKSRLYEYLTSKNLLVSHREHDDRSDSDKIIIEPEKLEFISYPYEWSYTQLRDAALLTLHLQRRALEHGMSLKDATAYNIQFRNGKPILIDTLSFEKYQEGKPWVAYKQFCQHFLAPLALASYRDIRLTELLRTNIDGVPLDLASGLLPSKSKLNLGIATHIHLHAKTQQKYAGKGSEGSEASGKKAIKKIGLLGLIDNLNSTIRKLKWKPNDTEWSDYYEITNYDDASFDRKKELVSSYIQKCSPSMLWDLGANDGTFSRLASEKGVPTIAFDIDPIAVEKNYLRIKEQKEKNLLPLRMDLTNPSPGLGWAHNERDSLRDRGQVDCCMALALIHHLCISNNVPLGMVAKYFAALGKHLIIEFVPKGDSQVDILLATREDVFPHYHIDGFEEAFSKYFDVVEKSHIEGTKRTLYLLKSKN